MIKNNRLIAAVLSAAMVFSTAPMGAIAAEEPVAAQVESEIKEDEAAVSEDAGASEAEEQEVVASEDTEKFEG